MNLGTTTRKEVEIGVEEAARRLGVSTRMIRNYLQEKRIQALKVGRQWFIDCASLEAFARQSGLGGSVPHVAVLSVAEPPPTPTPAAQAGVPPRENRSPRPTLPSLVCYRLCLEAFEMPLWQGSNEVLGDRLRVLKLEIIEWLGAGYYSYGTTKYECYDRARSLLGSALGLVYGHGEILKSHAREVAFIEDKCLPAFSALLKKLERRYQGGERQSQ